MEKKDFFKKLCITLSIIISFILGCYIRDIEQLYLLIPLVFFTLIGIDVIERFKKKRVGVNQNKDIYKYKDINIILTTTDDNKNI